MSEYDEMLRQATEALSKLANVRIVPRRRYEGTLSGKAMEVDLALETEVLGMSILIVVEIKAYNRPVGVDDVELFHARLEEIPAQKGIMITNAGYSAGAKRYADAKGIGLSVAKTLVSEEHLKSGVLVTDLGEVYAEIKEALARQEIDLYDLPPRKFEEFVAAIFQNHGYKVELTKASHDGGIDVIAIGENPIDQDLRIFVQCKRLRFGKPVRVSLVREMWGVISNPTHQFDRGIIATSSFLTRDALAEMESCYWRLGKQDHDDIMGFAGFRRSQEGVWLPQ
ncbi:MAG: restriction endonuclease [Deltaproteobacteria bacterium]|nr:restriction endonuclease [Deltaproteobacteria bacterium]